MLGSKCKDSSCIICLCCVNLVSVLQKTISGVKIVKKNPKIISLKTGTSASVLITVSL